MTGAGAGQVGGERQDPTMFVSYHVEVFLGRCSAGLTGSCASLCAVLPTWQPSKHFAGCVSCAVHQHSSNIPLHHTCSHCSPAAAAAAALLLSHLTQAGMGPGGPGGPPPDRYGPPGGPGMAGPPPMTHHPLAGQHAGPPGPAGGPPPGPLGALPGPGGSHSNVIAMSLPPAARGVLANNDSVKTEGLAGMVTVEYRVLVPVKRSGVILGGRGGVSMTGI